MSIASIRNGNHLCINGDYREVLDWEPAATLKDKFDIVMTDPGTYLENWPLTETPPFIKFLNIVTKPEAHLYMVCPHRNLIALTNWLKHAGWDPLIQKKAAWPLIWYHGNGTTAQPEYAPRSDYQYVLFASKGGKKLKGVFSDVIFAPQDVNPQHPEQKPVALWSDLLARSAKPGDKILDCFGGSGSSIIAGDHAKCHVTYIEKDPEYFRMGVQRLDELARLHNALKKA